MRDIAEILDHWQAGRSIRGISGSLGASRPAIRKYIRLASAHGYHPGGPPPAQGWQAFLKEVAPELFNPALGSAIFAELRVHHETIRESLLHTTVMTSWQRLREDPGISVSYSSFYRYVRKYLPECLEPMPITVRREDPPAGEEAQIDYGYLGLWPDPATGKKRRLWVFVMILSHSRHMFAQAVWRMDQTSWLDSHIAAFDFLGGVPRRLVLDNLATGVLKADLYDPLMNRGYAEMASYYGVLLDPARAAKPKDKPRVERMVPYIRSSFWAGRTFASVDEINRELRMWCLRTAGLRIHGTTRQKPFEVFREIEQAVLRPLPPEPFEIAIWSKAKVGRDCYVWAGGGWYTVPYRYYGKEIMIKLTPQMVQVYHEGELIKTHVRVGKWKRGTDWDDFPPEKAAFFRRTPDWCRQKARKLGEEVHRTVGALLDDHALYHLRQVHAIIRLEEKYGQDRLNAACGRANAFGDPAYRTVKNILERNLDRREWEEPAPVNAGAFLRGPQELFMTFADLREVSDE